MHFQTDKAVLSTILKMGGAKNEHMIKLKESFTLIIFFYFALIGLE